MVAKDITKGAANSVTVSSLDAISLTSSLHDQLQNKRRKE
jgi:hypothetical protein